MENLLDHLAINETFLDLNAAWMRDADGFAVFFRSLSDAMQTAGAAVAEHMRSVSATPPGEDNDVLMHWVNCLAWASRQYHQQLGRWLTEFVARAPELNPDVRRRAMFWIRQFIVMSAPANFFWTNPKAVKRYIDSNGQNVQRGVHRWLNDVRHSDGLPELADQNAFVVGENLAVTPGQVVFRNHLVEVIQYTAQTPTTWQVPIVLIQPWINKFYIFDLVPQNSFVNYLTGQGFTVFITSWKNPTAEMRHITFEDYMLQGALQAMTVAREICRSRKAHLAGYCIGGTLVAALMGWLAGDSDPSPVADTTLFATLLDFSEPGDMKVFIHPEPLKTVERLVADDGVLKGRYLALAFRLLNPNDLIWRYVVNNYFFGEGPPRSDMLYWNSDSTSLPGAMCTFYLKAFYLENRLVRPNALVLGQRPIDLKQVRTPMYVVGALKDHICPWQATFQTCRLAGGPVRYVLASEGHITGIVTPPSPWSKKKFWTGVASRRRDADRWLQGREFQTGSWWPDWVDWLRSRSGPRVSAPALGSRQYPPLASAPGTYVLE
jgi:polyhydroxyalkanoate synthase